MVADECEGYNANGFEDAVIDDKRATQLALGLGGDTKGLGDDCDNDNDHANQGEAASFGKLLCVSWCVGRGR